MGLLGGHGRDVRDGGWRPHSVESAHDCSRLHECSGLSAGGADWNLRARRVGPSAFHIRPPCSAAGCSGTWARLPARRLACRRAGRTPGGWGVAGCRSRGSPFLPARQRAPRGNAGAILERRGDSPPPVPRDRVDPATENLPWRPVREPQSSRSSRAYTSVAKRRRTCARSPPARGYSAAMRAAMVTAARGAPSPRPARGHVRSATMIAARARAGLLRRRAASRTTRLLRPGQG